MRTRAATAALFVASAACRAPAPAEPDWQRPLPYGASALLPLDPDESPPPLGHVWLERESIRPALERSIHWTRKEHANQFFPIAGITHERALGSLERFAELLDDAQSTADFEAAILDEFQIYKSAGWDGAGGGVLFTGYCTPILRGSLERDSEHRYALYALPPDLEKAADGTILGQRTDAGIRPYPTRQAIEANHMLDGRGLELVWLTSPLDAFIAHVNGSAFVALPDGSEYRLGYAGKNGRPYTSLGAELVRDGHIRSQDLNLSAIRGWAREHPELVQSYLTRNDSFVFFVPIDGRPRGSLNFEVSAQRTLATDKSLFPRGAIVYVDTSLPTQSGGRASFRQLMFDQDTGGAIRTAGRADIYLGVGHGAERQAGATRSEGQLYYFFLAE